MSDYPDDLDNLEKARGDSYYSDSCPEVLAELDAIKKGDHEYGEIFYDVFESEEFKEIINQIVDMEANVISLFDKSPEDFLQRNIGLAIGLGSLIKNKFFYYLHENTEAHLEQAHIRANAKRQNNADQ